MANSHRWLALSILAASLVLGGRGRADRVPRPASARAGDVAIGTTTVFPYRQRRLLHSRSADGGLAYVTSGASRGASLPVVVFLHGMNPDELMHPWFGPPFGDLRPLLESLVASGKVAPLVVAAPTHTRFATAATSMWPRFDLDDFLDATEAALGESAKIDRARVIVVGHSGAGCNAEGGILAPSVRRTKRLALVDVDGCVDDTTTPALGQASALMPVRFYWQHTWARPISELELACPGCKVEEITDLAARPAPHAAILPEVLRRALPELLPPATP